MGSCGPMWRAGASPARILIRVPIYLAAWLVAAAPAGALSLRTVALTGLEAPETGGATWEGFGPPVLNEDGAVAFTGTLQPGGAVVEDQNDLGMWSEGGGSLALVQRRGSPAPGTSSVWQTAISPPSLNDAGEVAFRASVSTPSANGVWHSGSGTLASVALSGTQADGAPAGQNFAGGNSEPAMNDTGQVAFHGSLSGGGVTTADNQAVWAGGPSGPLTLVARKGSAAAGTSANWAGFEGTLINGPGGVAFRASLDDGGTGIWAGPTTGVQLVARDGTTAGGVAGGEFANFIAPDLNDLGEVAFHAGLAVGVGGVSAGDDRGVWAGTAGSLTLLAREGDAAPDAGGRQFTTFSNVLTNDVGQIVFRGFLDTGTGLFLSDKTTLQKIVVQGDAAPGTELVPGLGDASFAGFTDLSFNDHGEVAFEAVLSGALAGVTGDNDGSLWLADRNGELVLIVREGDQIDFGLGDFGIVESIDFFGDSDTRGRGLNDKGWLTYGLTFTDGREGIFAAVPEPGSAALLALGLLGLGARRRC